jgi:hypothetical protein
VVLLLQGAGPVEVLGGLVREIDTGLHMLARSRTEEHSIRLRMSVQHGFITRDSNGWVSTAINVAARLVDAEVGREALRAHRDARLVLIVGDELYRDVIAQGHPGIDATAFERVRVVVKQYEADAWLQVLRHGTSQVPSEAPEPAKQPSSAGMPDLTVGTIGNYLAGPTTVDTIVGIDQRRHS